MESRTSEYAEALNDESQRGEILVLIRAIKTPLVGGDGACSYTRGTLSLA